MSKDKDKMMSAIKAKIDEDEDDEDQEEDEDDDSEDNEDDLQLKNLIKKANLKTPVKEVKTVNIAAEATWVEVPTQTTPMIKLESGEIITSAELQVIDHNLLLKVLRSIA